MPSISIYSTKLSFPSHQLGMRRNGLDMKDCEMWSDTRVSHYINITFVYPEKRNKFNSSQSEINLLTSHLPQQVVSRKSQARPENPQDTHPPEVGWYRNEPYNINTRTLNEILKYVEPEEKWIRVCLKPKWTLTGWPSTLEWLLHLKLVYCFADRSIYVSRSFLGDSAHVLVVIDKCLRVQFWATGTEGLEIVFVV